MSYDSHLRLLKIARTLQLNDPYLGYSLENSVRKLSVINPGSKPGFEHLEEKVTKSLTILKSLKQELEDAEKEITSDTAKEFAKFFTTEKTVEEEELNKLLNKKTASVAGIGDKIKSWFKKKPKNEPEEDQSGMSYDIDEDDFIEGKTDLKSMSEGVESEVEGQNDFFNGVKGVLVFMKQLREKPSKKFLSEIKKEVISLIKKGEKMIGAFMEESTPEEAPVKPHSEVSRPKLPSNYETTVRHYVDMISDNLDDEQKTLKYLKELFKSLGPALADERATVSAMIPKISHILKIASSMHPRLNSYISPEFEALRRNLKK